MIKFLRIAITRIIQLGLTEEQMVLLEKVVNQRKPMRVINEPASRKRQQSFGKMGDVLVDVTLNVARRIIQYYFDPSGFKQKDIERWKMLWNLKNL